jgi:hypothetical protein
MAEANARPRNRAEEALAKGRRLAMFELSQEFDALIEQVRRLVAKEQGSCSRVQALERMGRAGARVLLGGTEKKGRKPPGGT